jgi:hypothetical protein
MNRINSILIFLCFFYSGDVFCQCEMATDAELVIHQLDDNEKVISNVVKRKLNRLIKSDSLEYYMLLDFTEFGLNQDSILIEDYSDGSREPRWCKFNCSSKAYYHPLHLNELWSRPFIVLYIGCARVEIPIYSGCDYYKVDNIVTNTNSETQENEYQINLIWSTVK